MLFSKELSIVIPSYNCEALLPELIEQIDAALRVSTLLTHYEIIVICDRSPDNSWQVLKKLSQQYAQLKAILLRMNTGQHNALMAGLRHATGKYIITMDSDLQHSPQDISKLISEIKQGYDVVYTKFKHRKHPLWKILGSKFNNYLAKIFLKKPNNIYLSPFRILTHQIKDEVIKYQGAFTYLDGLILSVTHNISSVDVEHHKRMDGKGDCGLLSSISLWLKMMTNFSVIPLRVISVIGMVVSFVGLIMAGHFVFNKIVYNTAIQGWTSLIVVALVLGGVQLFSLGILGEYLGKIFLQSSNKPQYVIAEKINFNKKVEYQEALLEDL